MADIKITGGITLDYSEDGWSEYVKWLDGTKAALRFVYTEEEKVYHIVAVDTDIFREFWINKTDAAEFEATYKVLSDTRGMTLEGGMRPVTQMNGPYEAANYRQSWELEVPADSIGILDVFVGDYLVGPKGVCWLEGGIYEFYTQAVKGSAVYFSIVDRDGILLIPGTSIPIFDALSIPRTKITGLTNITGTIEVGHIVYGATSGAHARVISVHSDWCEVTFHAGPFDDGEALSFKDGETEEATATLGEWVEGGFYTAQTSVRYEYVRGYAQDDITPGGAKKLPSGLYLRAKIFNADTDNPAEVCVRFKVLTE